MEMRMMKKTLGYLMCTLLLSACCRKGGTTPDPSAAGAKLGGPTAVKIDPLKTAKEQKDQRQAVILGTKDGATAVPLAAKESRVGIDVMWVRVGGGGVPTTGGSSPVTMVTTPTGDNKVRVGVYEQYAGGAGSMMRSGVWIAAFVASTTLGKDLTDYKFAAESEGFVDGPSAGGLMTAAFLASITGAPIDPVATMTGTVNPDGTIGPVGGIPHKFEGSMLKGKKRLGYPVGLRYQEDMNKGTEVDLQQLAKDNGAEAIEIADIYEAYELLTGTKLPKPEALDEREMEIPHEVGKRIEEKHAAWLTWYGEYAARLTKLERSGNLPKGLERFVSMANAEYEGAARLVKQGLPGAAYYKAVRATIYAATASDVAEILDLVGDGKVDQATMALEGKRRAQMATVEILRNIGGLELGTISDHLLQMSAFQPAIAAFGYEMYGMQSLDAASAYLRQVSAMAPADQASPEVRDKLVEVITIPILMLLRGEAFSIVAKDTLEIEAEQSLAYKCSLPNARRLAKSFGSAAAANINYFESTIIEQYAKHYQISNGDMQEKFRSLDPKYLVAVWSFQLPRILWRYFEWEENSLPATLSTLAGAILSYQSSSSLMAEWSSLGVTYDAKGNPVVDQEKAFMNMLARAERKAREYAHTAKVAVGQVPVQSRIAYQTARVLREGSTSEKLRALELFWQSSVYSQVAVMLARN